MTGKQERKIIGIEDWGLKWQHREEGNGGKISREFWEECDFRFVFVFEFEIFPFFLSDLLSDQVSER